MEERKCSLVYAWIYIILPHFWAYRLLRRNRPRPFPGGTIPSCVDPQYHQTVWSGQYIMGTYSREPLRIPTCYRRQQLSMAWNLIILCRQLKLTLQYP